ncbi:MAG TPA: cobalamin biosynthesis protein [Planctomycetota bacterium]|nr:cobalamin biosynthesis protein [Planctomycetota bacterium]
MKTAVIAITKHGQAIARKLEGDRYISAKFRTEEPARYFDKPIKELTAEIWPHYEALVYVVSLGAVVRTIAPYLKDKHVDPAVIVVDDKAQYAISVLSGHVGGANELTEKIAGVLGAQALITTASDVGKTIPVDILGRELGWTTEQNENITKVSAAVVNEEPIAFVQETGEKTWWKRETPLPKNIRITTLADAKDSKAVLLVTDRLMEDPILERAVVYRPKSLVLGIGCDRGITCAQLDEFVQGTLREHRLSFKSVRNVATVDVKEDEVGLQEFCRKHQLGLVCYTSDQLREINAPNPSATVEKYVGTPGVSEPAAMLSSGGDLIVPKQKTPMMTLAVARVRYA